MSTCIFEIRFDRDEVTTIRKIMWEQAKRWCQMPQSVVKRAAHGRRRDGEKKKLMIFKSCIIFKEFPEELVLLS